MLFNSLNFLLFFPTICSLYWLFKKVAPEKYSVDGGNLILLIGSYYFYMCWNPTYALLLLTSTLTTFLAALAIDKCGDDVKRRKLMLGASVVFNLGILFFFKYYGFAAQIVSDIASVFGGNMKIQGLDVLLPVGISFYIFQALGYSIDVYRGTTKAERNICTYALFVSFFPQLVAGPIERSSHLLPQFKEDKQFDYRRTLDGFSMMLWGFFLKLALADRCASYADAIYSNLEMHNGGSYLIAAILFMLQIYGDFAGYSLIAIGSAKILGFDLMQNFRQPYLASSISEFWHRWHISLSTWFRDYVYIPLGGNRTSKARNYLNIFITFVVSGLWHGANWTYVLWGLGHGALQVVERMLGWHRKSFKGISWMLHWAVTMVLVCALWIVFRCQNIADIYMVFDGIAHNIGAPFEKYSIWMAVMMAAGLVCFKDLKEERGWNIHFLSSYNWWVRHISYVIMIVYILIFGVLNNDQFIYFQF